MTTFLDTN